MFHEGRWWIVRFGPAFLNLGFNTTLSTLENEDGESLDVVFKCYKQHELQSICIGELSELLVPLRDFNAGVAYALGVEALPD